MLKFLEDKVLQVVGGEVHIREWQYEKEDNPSDIRKQLDNGDESGNTQILFSPPCKVRVCTFTRLPPKLLRERKAMNEQKDDEVNEASVRRKKR